MTRSLARLEVQRRFRERGQSLDGGEAVTQQEYALQAAGFAEQTNSTPELVAAALLHDLADDAPDHGIDIAHETAGARWAERSFGPAVVRPLELHVAAKRHLCATDERYFQRLSCCLHRWRSCRACSTSWTVDRRRDPVQ